MLTQRYQVTVLFGLVAIIGCYLLLPLGASYLLAEKLRDFGYTHVILQLGYPGWKHMRVPVISFQEDLGEERLVVSVMNTEIQYNLSQLLQGRTSRIVLRDATIQVLNTPPTNPFREDEGSTEEVDNDPSPLSLITAGDLLRSLPILPFDELRLDHLSLFREQATGPLRRVTIVGSLTYSGRELGGHLSFRGLDTASYGLVVVGNSDSTWSAILASQRPHASPIVAWQSQAHPSGEQIQINGRLQVNVQELAPFIALVVPIGPELEKVTGHIAIDWSGKADADTTLGSLDQDAQTHLAGNIRGNATLPGLKGVAKDIALAYEGTFEGNAARLEWVMSPGVLLTATVNPQPRIIPEVIRFMLPHGDQPIQMENKQPVQGTLYWKETPVRMIVQGPLDVSYGQATGPVVAQFQTTRAEGVGRELVLVEGAYDLEGVLPKAITEILSAKEAVGGVRGTVKLSRTQVEGVLLPESSVTVKQIGKGTTYIPGLMLQLSEPMAVECDLKALHCSGGPMTATVQAPTLRIGGRNVHTTQGLLRFEQMKTRGSEWQTQGTFSVDGVRLDSNSWALSPSKWNLAFAADHVGIKADLRVDLPARAEVITARMQQPLQGKQGTLHGMVGPFTFNSAEGRLSKFVMGLPPSTDVVDGTFSVTVDASWSGGLGGSTSGMNMTSAVAKIVSQKLSGYYSGYVVKGLSTRMALHMDGPDSVAMVEPASIFATSIRSGVDISNLGARYQIRWQFPDELPIIDIKDFQCDVLGGKITTPGLMAELNKPPFSTTFFLHNLNLARILGVEQQRGLQGTGILNGTIPMTFTSTGVIVNDGLVEAQPPGGVLRYLSTSASSKGTSESDRHLQLVEQALNNFHYSLLRVGVRYEETGMLNLSARLEGKNPDLKNTPPIHFNLSVQEHIPTLLKSLRLVEDIQGSIERTYGRL
ncbi:MAG: YdbH domain-containing protein [Nitrospira sp.]|nr:YdbH domain-containing protein [Nitrospira sp.]